MFNALVHGQDRNATRSPKPTMTEDSCQIIDDTLIAIRGADDSLQVVKARQMQLISRDGGAMMIKQICRLAA